MIDYPLHHYRAMRSLPFLAPAALIAALLFARTPLRAFVRESRPAFAFLLHFVLLTGALLIKGLVRVGVDHMMMAIVASLILLALLLAQRDEWTRPVRAGIAALAAVAALLVLLCTARTGLIAIRAPDRMPLGALLNLGRAPVAPDPANPAAIANPAGATAPARGQAGPAEFAPEALCAAELVAAQTAPDARILVGTMRHDKLFVNMVELYFAPGRPPGTHWYHYDPGLQTRADIQAQMVADLQRNDVRWAIRDASFDGMIEPNGSAVSSGVTLLDAYLATRFRQVAAFGNVSVWARRDVPAPDVSDWSGCVAAKRAASAPRRLVGRLLG